MAKPDSTSRNSTALQAATQENQQNVSSVKEQEFHQKTLRAADEIDALIGAADMAGVDGEQKVLLGAIESLVRAFETAGYEADIDLDGLGVSSLCWQIEHFAALVRDGDPKHMASYRSTFYLLTEALRKTAQPPGSVEQTEGANSTKDTALLLSVTREGGEFEYALAEAPDMRPQEAAEVLFSIALDLKARADSGTPNSGRVSKAGDRVQVAPAKPANIKQVDTNDLRRRCDEIQFLIASFCGDDGGEAQIDIAERALMRAVREAAGGLEEIAWDLSNELGMYASRVKTLANLVLDAGSGEHDIPELEAILVRLLNDFRQEAGLAARTTGDTSHLAWQIAQEQGEAA